MRIANFGMPLIRRGLGRLVRYDDRTGGGEHAADAVADRDLGAGDLGGAVPRIWRTLSCKAYMPECV